jgi:nucleolar GTP-binding protein
MRIPSVPKASRLFDQAATQTPGQASLAINSALMEVVQGFPNFDKLDPFTAAMTRTLISRDEVKHALGRIHGVQRTLRRMAHMEKREFLGRLNSVLKKLDPALKLLGEARQILRRIPDPTISFTVCLAGYPNAGKSTLLKKLTGAKVEIANYEFTTKSLNYGTAEIKFHAVQVVDTPGTLNRTKANVIEKQALLALKYLAKSIVFVYDPLRESEDQEALFETLFEYKVPIAIFAAKQDIVASLPVFAQAKKRRIPVFTKPEEVVAWLEPQVLKAETINP